MPHTAIHHPGIKVHAWDQVMRWSRSKDTLRRRVTDFPTPESMASILAKVDQGDIAALLEMFDEMQAKEARIQAAVETREEALTGLEWAIEPDPHSDNADGKAAAEYVHNVLGEMPSWDTTLEHLAGAMGTNIAVTELIWDRAQLYATVDVPGHRLTGNPSISGQGVFIETDREPLGVRAMPGKFILYHPRERAGFPLRVTKAHALVVPFLMKHFSRGDWLAFSEIYGMPWRWVQSEDGIAPDDLETVKDMMANMGSDTGANLPAGLELKTMEVTGRGEVFKDLGEWADTTIAILLLGQTLTTEIGDKGSFAAARVHADVREDLLRADIKHERRMIREQVIRPMCMLRFPGKRFAVPHFVRKILERRDTASEQMDLAQMQAAREMRLPMPTDEVYKRLRMTRPDDFDQDVIGGPIS